MCIFTLQYTAIPDETTEGANGISRSAKTEEKELITRFIVVNDEPIAIHDVLVDAFTGDTTHHLFTVCPDPQS